MPKQITWQELRALADKVQGRQDRDQVVRIDDQGIHHEYASGKSGAATVSKVAATPKKVRLEVIVPNATFGGIPQCTEHSHGPNDIGCMGDALFWSMAAVEKFVLPYYASFWGLAKLTSEIRAAFEDENVLAILHRPDSEPTAGNALMGMSTSEWPRKTLTLLVRTSSGPTLMAFPSQP